MKKLQTDKTGKKENKEEEKGYRYSEKISAAAAQYGTICMSKRYKSIRLHLEKKNDGGNNIKSDFLTNMSVE